MAKILGLGGVFVHFKGEKQELHKWYANFFDLDMSEYGAGFIEGEQLLLISFKKESDNAPILNFRVDNLDDLFEKIKRENIKIIKQIQEFEYGKFCQIEDPFGNIIELWEPYTDEYKKMVKSEINLYKKGNRN